MSCSGRSCRRASRRAVRAVRVEVERPNASRVSWSSSGTDPRSPASRACRRPARCSSCRRRVRPGRRCRAVVREARERVVLVGGRDADHVRQVVRRRAVVARVVRRSCRCWCRRCRRRPRRACSRTPARRSRRFIGVVVAAAAEAGVDDARPVRAGVERSRGDVALEPLPLPSSTRTGIRLDVPVHAGDADRRCCPWRRSCRRRACRGR